MASVAHEFAAHFEGNAGIFQFVVKAVPVRPKRPFFRFAVRKGAHFDLDLSVSQLVAERASRGCREQVGKQRLVAERSYRFDVFEKSQP